MKTHGFGTILLAIFMFIGLGNTCLSAQDVSDWRSWTSIVAYYKFDKRLRMRTKLEYRMKDNLTCTDRWSVNAGLYYNVFSFLEVKGSYELQHRLLKDDIWQFRHRFHVGVQAFWKFYDFRLSWRERFQETVQAENAESVLRSRIRIDYNIPHTRLQPRFSTEIFQGLDGTFPNVFRIRYRPGLKIAVSDKYSFLLFYCRQYEKHRKANIAGLEMELNL